MLANIYFLVQLITFLTKYTIFHDLYFSATNVYFWRIGTFLLKNKFFLAHIGSLRHSCIVNHTNGSVVFYVEKLFFLAFVNATWLLVMEQHYWHPCHLDKVLVERYISTPRQEIFMSLPNSLYTKGLTKYSINHLNIESGTLAQDKSI